MLEYVLSLVPLLLHVSRTPNLWHVPLFSVCYRQHSLPRDDGGGVLLGRTGWQSGTEAVSSDMHVCQRILCLPFFICPRLWLLPLLSLTFWIRVRFSPSCFIVMCLFLIIVPVLHSLRTSLPRTYPLTYPLPCLAVSLRGHNAGS